MPLLIKTDFYKYNKDIEKPQYLSLNNSKIKNIFLINVKNWKTLIKNLLKKIKYKKLKGIILADEPGTRLHPNTIACCKTASTYL